MNSYQQDEILPFDDDRYHCSRCPASYDSKSYLTRCVLCSGAVCALCYKVPFIFGTKKPVCYDCLPNLDLRQGEN